ncbi:MAG: NUDIX hydrolase [Alphaproteobacteria bacterium]
MADEPATPRPAATMVLARDGADGIETFMVVRHKGMDFLGGAMVFPGGKLEESDSDPALRPYCRGEAEWDDLWLGLRVACIREAFEESGVLLARPRGDADFLSDARMHEMEPEYCKALHAEEVSMLEMAEKEDIEFATDALAYFAHWVTPDIRPKRFDTHFFLAPVPPGHVASHDGLESTDSEWADIDTIFESIRSGRRQVMYPTQCNLVKLNRSDTVAAALEQARGSKVVSVLPKYFDGVRYVPAEAGIGHVEVMGPKKAS